VTGKIILTHFFPSRIPFVAGPGILQKFIHKSKHLSPDERAEFLENYTELADAHSEGAHQGQTEV